MLRDPVRAMLFSSLLGACALQANVPTPSPVDTAAEAPVASHFDPLNCRPLPGNAFSERLCVLLTANMGDMWFIIGDSAFSRQRYIEGLSFTDNGSGQASFSDFSISPHGTYLAVVIAEEGHPTLLFTRLQQALQGHGESGGLPAIATYPGVIAIESWQDDTHILVRSDQNLVHYRHGGETGDFQDYLVRLPDGTITLPGQQQDE